MCISQRNKLKSRIKNETEITLNLSSNLIGISNDETNFPHKLLLSNTQVSKISKAFANVSLGNIKFSRIQFLNLYNWENLDLVHLMNLFYLMYLTYLLKD